MEYPNADLAALEAAWERAPAELQAAIAEFWQNADCYAAAAVAELESGFDAFAVNDSTDADHPCGSLLETRGAIRIVAERSIGYFQINACNFAGWEWQRLYNARHAAGTAHMLWDARGWTPWYFSATKLGLLG